MNSSVGLLGIGVVSFASTNMDDLLLLLILFSSQKHLAERVILSQFLGILLIIGVSCLGASLGERLVPLSWIPWMGAIPILVGIYKLYQLIMPDVAECASHPVQARSERFEVFALAALVFSSGGDNIPVYTALFVGTTPSHRFALILIYLFMTGIWCFLAHSLASHKSLGHSLRKWGTPTLPILLIGLGFWILISN